MIKFIPSYVGSKSFWVERLNQYQGRDFVEPFCGSGVLSANLARKAILNDKDMMVFNILSRFDELIVPETFTQEDYFRTRKLPDWWKYSFCLSKMSFSGVFRYSKNGFNVPVKRNISEINMRDEYEISLGRWNELSPTVVNEDYQKIIRYVKMDDVLVLDPPYENTKAAYNQKGFDYHSYWEFVRLNENSCKTVIIFDYVDNLPFEPIDVRKSRVNGKHRGNVEGMFIFEDSLKSGAIGEKKFAEFYKNRMIHLNSVEGKTGPDFKMIESGRYVELKSDYYSTEDTPNFAIELYSDEKRRTPGGPWQALTKGSFFFVYYFPKDSVHYIFETKKLVDYLDSVKQSLPPSSFRSIPNKGYHTAIMMIERKSLSHLYKEVRMK